VRGIKEGSPSGLPSLSFQEGEDDSRDRGELRRPEEEVVRSPPSRLHCRCSRYGVTAFAHMRAGLAKP
jgi:hypothetical protein